MDPFSLPLLTSLTQFLPKGSKCLEILAFPEHAIFSNKSFIAVHSSIPLTFVLCFVLFCFVLEQASQASLKLQSASVS